MTDADFQKQIAVAPANLSGWFYWADWLEENGRGGEAEIIRLRLELTQHIKVPQLSIKCARLQQLVYQEKYSPPTVWHTHVTGLKLALITPGQFLMGSPVSEEHRDEDEKQVKVTLERPFYLGIFPVTQAEFRQVIGLNPSWFSPSGEGQKQVVGLDTTQFPLEWINATEAQEFCELLSEMDYEAGHLPDQWEYRLPTEAEWEYACRAGSRSAYSWGDSIPYELAQLHDPQPGASRRPGPVGQFLPNAFGLYDMHGTISEWCRDIYQKRLPGGSNPEGTKNQSEQVHRGGSWNSPSVVRNLSGARFGEMRSARRRRSVANSRSNSLGLRVALVPPTDK